ncbi:Predicted nucleotidyltransferase [Caloranaerobacter azorensis DSM 13643]|uniref:tRNA(Met) cytidine acetate ligase n=1 Tax=Caloranaerobacter azorensis DSM 13643 TaxID=1121264 RepID=A0A1M5RQG0_9FIRM|nr:nucleotidyltransferase [Caloranaerobacter azorensis]SHH28410.1 Predicted nucleotidyltransferase [Caloranaerobacter azorensis DSM 13643]
MKVLGLITEYNPFHNGHLYHLKKSKEITDCDYSICVMSGSFVQRGEPALVDKWTRAKMAIDSGVDLVIELPTIYSSQSAEFFAYGAIKILDGLGIVDCLCFGSEIGNLNELNIISNILVNETEEFKHFLKKYLTAGYAYPKARSLAISDYLKSKNIDLNNINKIISSPNNILAIEYLKALKKINSNIKPYTIKRINAEYNDINMTGEISSATAIRNEIFKTLNGIENIKSAVPNTTYSHLKDFLNKYGSFNNIENYAQIIRYHIARFDKKSLTELFDIENGLENRILNCIKENTSIKDTLNCIKTKRYTYTRLQRLLIQMIIGLDKKTLSTLYSQDNLYIRVLGFNQKGKILLNKAKKKSKFPIITKFANYRKINDNNLNKIIEIEKRATDIYFLGLPNYNGKNFDLDYLISPYMKIDG